ncbi:MAG: hypothetical protein JXA25_02320 [Anaerolineales bacterium]|nr:hypothetical protein [Anaerolineales bacterium]
MQVFRIESENRRQVREFLNLPETLYHSNPNWVPAFRSDLKAYFNRDRNPFYKHSGAAFFLAYDDESKPAGRLAVLEPVKVNERLKTKMGFFFLYECIEQLEVSKALFAAGERWAVSRGLDMLYGPKGFTALDPIGILVEGFEIPAAMSTGYHFPYYQDYILASGFEPAVDLLTGTLTKDSSFPERIHWISEKVQQERNIRVVPFRSRREMLRSVPELAMLFNQALGVESVNAPMSEDEIRSMVRVLMLIAQPALIKMITKDDEPIGFVLAFPDVSKAIRSSRGRLLPFGWLQLLLEARRTKRFAINGIGILEEHRGAGGLAVLYNELYLTLRDTRGEMADVIQIWVENEKMLRTLRGFGIDFNRKHRMYRKRIDMV